jgi:hypothetical protein
VCSDLAVTWGDGHVGTVTWCGPVSDAIPRAGDTVPVWSLPGWGPVRAESLAVWTPVAIVVVVLIAGAAWSAVGFARQAWAVERVRRGAIGSRPFDVRIVRMVIGRGVFQRDGRVVAWARLSADDDHPLRLVVPGPTDRTLIGAAGTLCPLARGRGDRPRGPYVLRRAAHDGRPPSHRVMLGRSVRSVPPSG